MKSNERTEPRPREETDTAELSYVPDETLGDGGMDGWGTWDEGGLFEMWQNATED